MTEQMTVVITALEGEYRILYQITGADGETQTAEAVFTVAAEDASEGETESENEDVLEEERIGE